jgi:hypothetical protein
VVVTLHGDPFPDQAARLIQVVVEVAGPESVGPVGGAVANVIETDKGVPLVIMPVGKPR